MEFFFFLTSLSVLIFKATCDPVVNCTIYKDKLQDAISSYSGCTIEYSRPVRICEECVHYYINMLNSYQDLNNYKNDFGPCIDMYTNSDRLQVLNTMYFNSMDLWETGKCSECFKTIDGSLTDKPSEKLNKFNKLFGDLEICIDQRGTNESTSCKNCFKDYMNLNDYYATIIDEDESISTCMDIVDLMNGTRSFWNDSCYKYRYPSTSIYFYITTLTVIIGVICFYTLVKGCTQLRNTELLKQNRFARSFERSTASYS